MKNKNTLIITVLAVCILLIPSAGLQAMNLQTDPITAANLKPTITIVPADSLDPQPEPPMTIIEPNKTLQIVPLDALDPQPEPPNEIKTTIKIDPVNMLNPQPEPPIYVKDIKILINNIPFDSLDPQPEPPMIYQGRTLVPMRAIFERLGAEVMWDNNTRTITAKKGTIIITMKPGEPTATINGQIFSLDVSPIISNNRTYVPLRFIGQAFGNTVEWSEQSRTIQIF